MWFWIDFRGNVFVGMVIRKIHRVFVRNVILIRRSVFLNVLRILCRMKNYLFVMICFIHNLVNLILVYGLEVVGY